MQEESNVKSAGLRSQIFEFKVSENDCIVLGDIVSELLALLLEGGEDKINVLFYVPESLGDVPQIL